MLDAADRAAGLRLPPLCPPDGAAVRLYYLPHSAPVIIELAEHCAFTGTCLSSRSSASPKSDFGTDPVSCVPRWMAMDDALKFESSPIAMSSKASSAHPSRRGPVATSGLRSSAGRPPRGSDAVLTAVAFPWVREPGHRANSASGPRCPRGRAAHAATRGRSEARWHGDGQEPGYCACGRDKPNVGLAPIRGARRLQALLDRAFGHTVRRRPRLAACSDAVVAGRWSSHGSASLAIGLIANQGRDAPEVEPHTPPHAAQTAPGGANHQSGSKARRCAPVAQQIGQWPIWPGPAVLALARRIAVIRTAVRFARSSGRSVSGRRRSRCSITLALRFRLAQSGPWVRGRAACLPCRPRPPRVHVRNRSGYMRWTIPACSGAPPACAGITSF
jgi:hypothetical protein